MILFARNGVFIVSTSSYLVFMRSLAPTILCLLLSFFFVLKGEIVLRINFTKMS